MLDTIRTDLKDAMKAGNKLRITALRNLIAKIKAKEIEKGENLDKNESLKVCLSASKQIKESIKQFKDAGRHDLVENELSELDIIEGYLPKQLSEEEILVKIKEKIACSDASSAADMGKIMGPLMKELSGLADGKIVQRMVIKELNK
tara:strand:- start:2493 stop:2933 length:441 start_codon:yes stop_codon:yes gene_type:complete